MRAHALLVALFWLCAGCALLPSGRTAWPADDVDGWTPVPTDADPRFREVAERSCLDDGPTDATTLVLHDQRGPDGAAFLFTGSSQAACLVLQASDGRLEAHDRQWSANLMAPGGLAVRDTNGGAFTEVYGVVDPEAIRVELTRTAGPPIEATIGGGYLVAWWPGQARVTEARAFDANGDVIASWP